MEDVPTKEEVERRAEQPVQGQLFERRPARGFVNLASVRNASDPVPPEPIAWLCRFN